MCLRTCSTWPVSTEGCKTFLCCAQAHATQGVCRYAIADGSADTSCADLYFPLPKMSWTNGIDSDDENDEDGDGDGSQVQEEDMTRIPPCYARREIFCSIHFFLAPYGWRSYFQATSKALILFLVDCHLNMHRLYKFNDGTKSDEKITVRRPSP